MTKLTKDDFSEEKIWAFKCPHCGEMSETWEEPETGMSVECQHCYEWVEVEDE